MKNRQIVSNSLITPWVAGFLIWVSTELTKLSVSRVWFVSREGDFLCRAWNALNLSPKGYYIPLSRALLYKINIQDSDERVRMLSASFSGDLGELLVGRLGIPRELSLKLFPKELMASDASLPARINQVQQFLEANVQTISTLADQEKENFKLWLGQSDENWHDSNSIAIVDVGYAGSMQRLLEKTLGLPLSGFYIMSSKSSAGPQWNSLSSGWLVEDGDWETNLLLQNSLRLENLLQSKTGPCIGFRKGIRGVDPVFGAKYQHQLTMDTLLELQETTIEILENNRENLTELSDLNAIGKALLTYLLTSDNPALGFASSIKSVDEFTTGKENIGAVRK